MTDVTVTDRLATGLARHAIRQWRAQIQTVSCRTEAVRGRWPTTGKGLRKLVRDMRQAYAPHSFHAFTLESRKGCVLSCVVPGLKTLDHVDHLTVEQAHWIFDVGDRRRGSGQLLAVHPHALARLFLRLQTVELARVRQELASTLVAWPALRHACERLQLPQVVVATHCGVFRCDMRPDARQGLLPVAKTWISFSTIGERDLAVVHDVALAVSAWREENPKNDDAIGSGLIGMPPPEDLTDALAGALQRHTWLRTPYTERRDYLSEMWDAARQQSRISGRQIARAESNA